jgi:5'-3' exonuclease
MKPTFILIDGSYFIVHRYECMFAWWKLHGSKTNHDGIIEAETEDLFETPQFVERFKELFHSNLQTLTRDLHLSDEQMEQVTFIVGKDCQREQIWRNDLFPHYKGNRGIHETRKKFVKMVYEEKMFEKGGVNQILYHPKLEADDCVAISTKYLLNKYGNDGCTIFIITSDKDYLQLATTNVHIYNLNFKKLTEQKSSYNNAECDLFCKILTGDKSDNIPSVFPRCGPKTALKYYNDKTLFQKKIEASDEQCKKQLELNTTIIDFKYIPEEYANEIINLIEF